MYKERIKKALDEIKKQPKKKFVQSYDLIINLKNLVVKTNPIDFFVTLPYDKGPKVKVAAFVDRQLEEQAKKYCDLVIKDTEFTDYSDKKKIKKLAQSYDYFIAQSTLMPKVAATFGRYLGGRGKMPNPKLGCVVLPNALLEPLVKKLQTTVRLTASKGMNFQCLVGKEDQKEEQVVENIFTIYQTVIKNLPSEMQNVKNIFLKSSMGKPVKV